jgi:O-antigen/teichoic acid export membrane protein
MAIAQSILTAANLLSDVGLQQAVVRSKRGHEKAFLDTIWTLQVAKGLLMFALMAAMGPFAARGYDQPALMEIMPGLGIAALISGFASTKIALVNRKIEIGRLTAIEIGSQVVGIVVMLAWAWAVPTTWALVAGNIANSLARVAASHWVLKGPGNSFAWDRSIVAEVWQFGGWVMLSSGVTFLVGEGRNLLNAALVDASVIGMMVLSSTLVFVVWNAIQQVSGRVLFPAYAEVWRDRPDNLPTVVERSRRAQLLGGCAIAMIFALFGDRLVHLFYDSRYREAGAFIQIQAVGTMFSFLSASYSGVLWAIGRPGLNTVILAIQAAVVAVLVIVGHALGGTIGLVALSSCTGLVMYPINAYIYGKFGLFQPKTDALPLLMGIAAAAYVAYAGSWIGFWR